MNKVRLITFCMLAVVSNAQSADRALHFDLSKIGMVVNGEQICNDTSRMQDVPSKVMDQITAGGTASVPVLIGMVSDGHMAQTREPIICYWPGMTIGDIAFCLLTDLFLSTRRKTTVPGADWNEMLGSDQSLPAWEQLHSFNKKYGKTALQAKWQRLWNKYGGRVRWDDKENCFKLIADK